MLFLEFWKSYFSKYLRLIAVFKSSQRRCSIKKLLLKILQNSQENTFVGALRTATLSPKNIWGWLLFCNSPVLSTIIFKIHTKLFLHLQLSLLRDIFCVISCDNNIERRVLLHKIKFNLHGPRILEIELNNVKIWKRNWMMLIHVIFQKFLLKFVENKTFKF